MKDYTEVYKAHNLPLFDVETITVPGILLGHNPFLRASYFSAARKQLYARKFGELQNIVDMICYAIEKGIAGIFVSCEDNDNVRRVIEAVRTAQEKMQTRMFVSSNVGNTETMGLLEPIRESVKMLLVHGAKTGKMYSPETGEFEELSAFLKAFREFGAVPGIVTHEAATHLPQLRQKDYDCQVVACCYNRLGWTMKGTTPEEADKEMRECDVPVMVFKLMAMARIPPEEAFESIKDKPYIKSVILGVAEKDEIDEDLAAYRAVVSTKDEG